VFPRPTRANVLAFRCSVVDHPIHGIGTWPRAHRRPTDGIEEGPSEILRFPDCARIRLAPNGIAGVDGLASKAPSERSSA
jgi:hypothetical protein